MDIYHRESGTGMTYNGLTYNYWYWEELSVKRNGTITAEIYFFDTLERAQDGKGYINSRNIVWQIGAGDAIPDGVGYLELVENYPTDDGLVLTLKDSIKI